MNPTKQVIEAVEDTVVTTVEVPSTAWFNAAKKEPGQPGVFEVNPVQEFDGDELPCRRFSYWNGKSFAAICINPETAFYERFKPSVLAASITHFRGLTEAA